MLTYYSPDHRGHADTEELILGKLVASYERPERVDMILDRIAAVGLGEVREAPAAELDDLLGVHDRALLHFLESAWGRWEELGRDGCALPYAWRYPRGSSIVPQGVDGALGSYAMDAGTPIVAGTWSAVVGSAGAAVAAAQDVADGAAATFALCRPPGHHAGRDYYGGYCFVNNAAVAAQKLSGLGRVAILDIDYHHGNGTQDIFWERPDVLFASLHGDPNVEYPYFSGHADERGGGDGVGATCNYPMPWGTGFDVWGASLSEALRDIEDFGAAHLVVSLGADAYVGDPICHFELESPDFEETGRQIAELGLPTLFVMEGGYAVDALGVNVANVLQGFEAARDLT